MTEAAPSAGARERLIEAAVDWYNMPCTISDYNLLNAVQFYLGGQWPQIAREYGDAPDAN